MMKKSINLPRQQTRVNLALVDLCEVQHRPKLLAQHIFGAHRLAPQLQLLNQM
jgi:hypothetical protein